MIRSKPHIQNSPDPIPLTWQCASCHLINEAERTSCSSCSAPRLNGKWPTNTWLSQRRPIALANTHRKEPK